MSQKLSPQRHKDTEKGKYITFQTAALNIFNVVPQHIFFSWFSLCLCVSVVQRGFTL